MIIILRERLITSALISAVILLPVNKDFASNVDVMASGAEPSLLSNLIELFAPNSPIVKSSAFPVDPF